MEEAPAKPSVFIETTIPSYYVARRSRNLELAECQCQTRQWWDLERHRVRLFTSEVVLDEAAEGEPEKAQERLQLLSGIPLLQTTGPVEELAIKLVERGFLPKVAGRDAYHIAAAGVHQIDFLLTWNCKHLANPYLANRIKMWFFELSLWFPVICTPPHLLSAKLDASKD